MVEIGTIARESFFEDCDTTIQPSEAMEVDTDGENVPSPDPSESDSTPPHESSDGLDEYLNDNDDLVDGGQEAADEPNPGQEVTNLFVFGKQKLVVFVR